MSKVRVNYKSDLPPVAVKFKINGNIVDVPDHDFIIRFFVDGAPGTSFECAHKGDEYINCAKTVADTLTCYINNHKFGCGRLCCEFTDLSADSRYSDKVLKTVTPSCLDVVLVEGAGDSNVEVLNVIFGYEINEIASITAEESEEDGGTNTVTITETNGEEISFGVKNGTKGSTGKSAYQSYVDTTTDVPVLSESEWVASLKGADGVDVGEAVLVNDLTTGGATNVLSAEQGKVIGDILNIEEDTETVTERIPYVGNYGYIGASSVIANGNAYFTYSDPIHLNAGDSLKIKGITPSHVGRLASCDAQGGNVERLLLGQSPETPTSASDVYENTYTATEDIYVIVGWWWDFYQLELTLTHSVTTTTSKVDDIDTLNDVLDIDTETKTVTQDVSLTAKVGGYAGATVGRKTTYNSNYGDYRCSEKFFLKKGDTIQITANNVSTALALLAVEDREYFRTLIAATNSNQVETYTAPLDGYYVVSWNYSKGVSVSKTSTNVVSDSERLASIETSTTQIPVINGKVEDLEDIAIESVTDPLTTGLVEGKFIANWGDFVTNSDYAYKEIVVKAGAKIHFTATMHSQLAAIAKRIPHTNAYEVLVSATAIAVETFDYTATEEMTIAVSFKNTITSTHTITITTPVPTSNRLNIENVYDLINIKHHVDFGLMFNKIAVIGDSLASGRVEGIQGQSDAVGADFYNFSWLAFLAKKWRCEAFKNYSNAQATTASWISTWLPIMQADATVYDAYFIALGTNNEYNESNPSGDQENYEAFIQRYNYIIDAVRTKAPHAVIFILSLYQKRAGNAALEDIAEDRMSTDDGVFYLDYANKAEYFRYSSEVNWRGHFSSTGYVYVAEAINRIVNDVVWDNQQEEFWRQFAKYHNNN